MARVEWYGERAEAAADAGISGGIRRGLDEISDLSQQRVPVLTTELKRSHGTSHDGNSGSVYYTDNKAAVAHENPRKRRYRNGKREKYLESAMNDGADNFLQALAAELREVL